VLRLVWTVRVAVATGLGFRRVLGLEFRAIRRVLMAVRGVERLLERDTAASREGQRIRAARHHFVARQQAAHDFHKAVIHLPDLHLRFYEGILQIEVFDVDETVRRFALQRPARHADHAGTFAEHDGKLRAHVSPQQPALVWQPEDGVDVCDGARFHAAGLVFRHARDGIDLGEVGDFQQRLVRLERIAKPRIDFRHQPGNGCFQQDARRRIARLAALQPRHVLARLHLVAGDRFQLHDAAWHAAAHRRDFAGNRFDAAESKDDFFEVSFLDLDGFDTEIFHSCFVEHDRVSHAFGIHFFGGEAEAGSGAEGQRDEDAFHYFELLMEGLDWPVAAACRMRASW
jgi:hypothetical protein